MLIGLCIRRSWRTCSISQTLLLKQVEDHPKLRSLKKLFTLCYGTPYSFVLTHTGGGGCPHVPHPMKETCRADPAFTIPHNLAFLFTMGNALHTTHSSCLFYQQLEVSKIFFLFLWNLESGVNCDDESLGQMWYLKVNRMTSRCRRDDLIKKLQFGTKRTFSYTPTFIKLKSSLKTGNARKSHGHFHGTPFSFTSIVCMFKSFLNIGN